MKSVKNSMEMAHTDVRVEGLMINVCSRHTFQTKMTRDSYLRFLSGSRPLSTFQADFVTKWPLSSSHFAEYLK